MAKNTGIRRRVFDPRDLDWMYPTEAIERLGAFRQLCNLEPPQAARPLPNRKDLEILGRITRHLFPDGTAAHLAETGSELASRDREYLMHLAKTAELALQRRASQAAAMPLGFLPEPREKWVQMLTATWIVPPPGARLHVRP